MTSVCEQCGATMQIGDWPYCPHGPVASFNVQDDSIPGGMVVENLSRHPQTFYSKGDFRKAMAAAGVEQRVRHVGTQGSDRSPHTTRWI